MPRKAKELPSRETLLGLMNYDKEQGALYWKVIRGRTVRPGDRVGGPGLEERRLASVNGRRMPVSHIIWFLETGQWPQGAISHIDRNGLNDRIDNLREKVPR